MSSAILVLTALCGIVGRQQVLITTFYRQQQTTQEVAMRFADRGMPPALRRDS
jgi:hypothetical protein